MKNGMVLAEYSFPDNTDYRGLQIVHNNGWYYLNCLDLDEGFNIWSIPFMNLGEAKKYAKLFLIQALDDLFN